MIEVDELLMTCGACPSQWEGVTDEGKRLYIRYRWGYLRIDLDDETIYGSQVGDEMDGYMDYKELKSLTKDILDLPEETDKVL